MPYVNTNVTKTTNAGKGASRKAKVFIFNWDDIATHTRVDNVVSGLVFKAGKYGVEVYADQKSIKTPVDTDGEHNSTAFTQTVEFMHPGDAIEIRDYLSNWVNKEVGCVLDYCDGTTPKLYGAPCAPLSLQAKGEESSDKTNKVMTFKSVLAGPINADFTTTTTLASVNATVAANATTVDVATGAGEFQLTTGTASAVAITTLSNPVHGFVYSLIGSGGTYPSTISASATVFLLKDGTMWTALAGSKITFKCFKDGASTFKFVEVSRV